MKKKTNKLINLEKNRKSILTDNLDYCYICNDYRTELHEIYGGSNRKVSMENNFVIPICSHCHRYITDNPKMSETLKKNCQKEFEKEHTREDFLKIIGRSYL